MLPLARGVRTFAAYAIRNGKYSLDELLEIVDALESEIQDTYHRMFPKKDEEIAPRSESSRSFRSVLPTRRCPTSVWISTSSTGPTNTKRST